MDLIYAYHITKKSAISSILKNGLVPNIGENSIFAGEHVFLTYFTTLKYVELWLDLFEMYQSEAVILKFPCTNYTKRDEREYFTLDSILPENISVVLGDDEEQNLEDYYKSNKENLDIKTYKLVNQILDKVTSRLKEIEFVTVEPEPENSWDYYESEPNLVDIINLLKLIRCLDDKSEFVEILKYIKEKTFKKLITNDLGITSESSIYKSLELIFSDSLSNNPKIDLIHLNIATTLVSINLFYRQLDRWERTTKKYGDDNTIWNYDRLHLDEIGEIINESSFKKLFDETVELHDNRKKCIR